jgi:hypothetical protein
MAMNGYLERLGRTVTLDLCDVVADYFGARPARWFAMLIGLGVIAAIVGALSACQTPAVKDRVVEVSVPVAVQPIKPAQVPVVPAPLVKRPASLSAAADLLLAKVCELEAYALKADPLLRVSAKMPPQALPKYPECER